MIKRIDLWLSRLCLFASGTAIIVMALVAFIDSIGRTLNHPLQGASEYVIFSLLIFFFSAMPLVVRDNAHIRVGLLADLYRPRLAHIETIFTGLIEVIALSAFAWMIFDQADRLQRFGTLSVFFELPMAPFVAIAGVFSVISIWFAIHNLWLSHKDQFPRAPSIPDDVEHREMTPRPHAIPDEEENS